MSIQRYGDPSHDYMTPAHDDGFLVLYSDHVAAVAAAERRVAQAHRDLCLGANGAMGQHEWLEAKGYAEGWDKGRADALQEAAYAVAVVALGQLRPHMSMSAAYLAGVQEATRTIDALREEKP